MKTTIGMACLVLAIFLTPAAWDAIVNSDVQTQGGWPRHVLPAAIAWMIGLWLLARGSKTST
jgi:hypothetical protein